MLPTETHSVPLQEKPIRLQDYGAGIFTKTPTKSALKKALKKELISVDGKIATTATFLYGHEVIIFREPPSLAPKKTLVFPLEVVYQDDYLAVIYKPAGILTSGNKFITVANALAQNLHSSTQEDKISPRPAHRLDYPTTGLLLIGKTNTALAALHQLFEHKTIAKTYFAVAIGAMKTQGTIQEPVDGKMAISSYEVLKTVPSERFQWLNLVKLSPKTGRRHQLRKHLASLNNPILGDKEYGTEPLILNGKGLYLHAYSLTFTHPFSQEKMTFTKALPSKFTKLFPDYGGF
ncbi:23S rRNA pseudouridine1911/1915/1917 synthase [Arenibacter nanhaiticus]|uniref:23S rRNA pseudouridine1911/1915/1917 synthase n=1 Tax=Arenibacter nanhaiticus TaxID=558155 RepID=A0A1M6IUR4_9FLAO|nr:RluA family pseudouridine synthase [Arenibacter nanhaiticus]SHJ38185.1 23S rRNA pseudouridine1911/1915/1917 synthase [Arenibacter nanhaiticus]